MAKSREIVTQEQTTPRPDNGQVAQVARDMGISGAGTALLTTINADTDEARALTYELTRGEGTPISDVIGQEIEIVHWVMFPVQLENEDTGELVTRPKIMMRLADGRTITTTSPVVAKDLLGYREIVLRGNWNRAVKFVPRMVKHKPPRFFYTLESRFTAINSVPAQRVPRTPKTTDAPAS